MDFVSFLTSWGASSRGGLEDATVAGFRSMIGENRQVVADEPVEFEKKPVELKTVGNLPMILKEFIEYTAI